MAPHSQAIALVQDWLVKQKPARALRELQLLLSQQPEDDGLLLAAAELFRHHKEASTASALVVERFESRCRRLQMREALALFERMQGWGPQPASRFLLLASSLESARQRLLAERWYRQAAEAFQRAGSGPQELVAWQSVLRMKPRSIAVVLQAAARAEALGDSTLAVRALLLAAEQRHHDPVLLEQAVNLRPEDAEIRLHWARALHARRQFEAAWKALEPLQGDAVLDQPRQALLNADLLLSRGALDEAASRLSRFLDRPDGFTLALRCCRALAQQGSRQCVPLARQVEAAVRDDNRTQWAAALNELLASAHEEGLLDYLAESFERLAQPERQAQALYQRYDLAVAAGEFTRAADLLDHALELDPYEPSASERLQALRGRVPQPRWETFCARVAPQMRDPTWKEEPPVSLRDLLLQAEIFLQYQVRGQAAERLRTALRLFPETARRAPNFEILLQQAGLQEEVGVISPASDEADAESSLAPPPRAPAGVARIPLGQIHQAMRAVQRRSTPARILASAVQQFGRLWKADMVVATRFHSGQPLLHPVEYYGEGFSGPAPDKLRILLDALEGTLRARMPIASPLRLPRRSESAEMLELFRQLEVESLLVQPLDEAGNLIGAVVVASRQPERNWTEADGELLTILTDQMLLALQHSRLRSLLRQFARRDEGGTLRLSSWMELLVAECSRAREHASTLTVVALELPYPNGEPEGLAAEWLDHLAHKVTGYLHADDAMTRLRPHLWLFLLPDSTAAQGAALVLKLRSMFSEQTWPDGRPLQLAAGVAEMAPERELPVADSVLPLAVEDVATDVLDRALEALPASRRTPSATPAAVPPAELTVVGAA